MFLYNMREICIAYRSDTVPTLVMKLWGRKACVCTSWLRSSSPPWFQPIPRSSPSRPVSQFSPSIICHLPLTAITLNVAQLYHTPAAGPVPFSPTISCHLPLTTYSIKMAWPCHTPAAPATDHQLGVHRLAAGVSSPSAVLFNHAGQCQYNDMTHS